MPISTPKAKKIIAQSVKGMHDVLPEEQPYWDLILKKARQILDDYDFKRIDTPIVEQTSLFSRSVGESTDIVEKEMYSFKTKGKDDLTLRPEFTSSIVRAYIEHGMHVQPQPVQLWTHGPLFRHENPQAGRTRQHYQIDAELFGDDSPAADAQVIFLAYKILEGIGLKGVMFKINSIGDTNCRPQYLKALKEYYRGRDKKLCGQCQKRLKTNILRLLDCKNETCKEISKDVPQFVDYLDDDCKKHFKNVLEFLDEVGVPYILDHTLVRGLDYYTRTTFEIVLEQNAFVKDAVIEKSEEKESEEEKKEVNDKEEVEVEVKKKEEPKHDMTGLSLGGGGRYDRLVEFLGGPKTPAIGWGIGIERLVLALKAKGTSFHESRNQHKVFIAQLGDMGKKKSLVLFEEFRKAGVSVKASFGRDGIKSQLRMANRLGIPYTIIIGQKEALEGVVIVREMSTGVQENVPVEKVIDAIKHKTKK